MPLYDQLASFEQLLIQLKRQLQTSVQEQPTSPPTMNADAQAVSQSLRQLQNQFQAIISAVDSGDIDPKAEQSLMSYQTEAHRRLRLMTIEAMRLQTARQPQTVERVRSQLKDHLSQVQQFVQAMRREVSE
ncbi:MAG: heterocyst frequency control protein PatD [Cyanobacteria bacterium J06621_11]